MEKNKVEQNIKHTIRRRVQQLKLSENILRFSDIKDETEGKPTILYLLHFKHKYKNIEFLKYGITTRSVALRYYGYKDYNYNILEEYKTSELRAKCLERAISIHFIENKFIFSDSDIFAGYTECLEIETINNVIQYINEFKENF